MQDPKFLALSILVRSIAFQIHSTKSCLQSAWIRAVQDPKFPAWYHPGLIKFPVWYHPGRFNFPAWYHPAFSTKFFSYNFSESSCYHPGLFADQDGNRATRLKRPNHPRCRTTLPFPTPNHVLSNGSCSFPTKGTSYSGTNSRTPYFTSPSAEASSSSLR